LLPGQGELKGVDGLDREVILSMEMGALIASRSQDQSGFPDITMA
jgi:hypothetical protein